MKKILLGALIGFVVAGLLGAGTLIFAQERQAPAGPLVVIGGLKLQEGADAEGAEKLLKEQLIPAMNKVNGLEMKVLKRMMPQQRGQTQDSGAYDYVMLAEIESLGVFMQLLRSEEDAGLSAFGDMMKKYAGKPYINAYTILAKTEEKSGEIPH